MMGGTSSLSKQIKDYTTFSGIGILLECLVASIRFATSNQDIAQSMTLSEIPKLQYSSFNV